MVPLLGMNLTNCKIIIFLYGSTVPFFHVCVDFFHQKYNTDSATAALLFSIPDWIAALFSPLCGILVDKYGKRGFLLPVAAGLILITHSLFLWTNLTPYVAMSVMGISYTLFGSVLWPCVPFLVMNHQIATAYGLLTTALNTSLFIFPFD